MRKKLRNPGLALEIRSERGAEDLRRRGRRGKGRDHVREGGDLRADVRRQADVLHGGGLPAGGRRVTDVPGRGQSAAGLVQEGLTKARKGVAAHVMKAKVRGAAVMLRQAGRSKKIKNHAKSCVSWSQ